MADKYVKPAKADDAKADEVVSSQAHFSTYSELKLPDDVPTNPPPGRFVQQTLGAPSEGDVKPPPTP